jgi:hypothetical protein
MSMLPFLLSFILRDPSLSPHFQHFVFSKSRIKKTAPNSASLQPSSTCQGFAWHEEACFLPGNINTCASIQRLMPRSSNGDTIATKFTGLRPKISPNRFSSTY